MRQPRHAGRMRLKFKVASACVALLDDRADHCMETLAVTLQVSNATHAAFHTMKSYQGMPWRVGLACSAFLPTRVQPGRA